VLFYVILFKNKYKGKVTEMVETYPWWNEKQKKLMAEAKKFADEHIPEGEEIYWTKRFPSELIKKVAEKGWFGAVIPEEYGGLGAGVTGVSIIAEELSRVCAALTGSYSVTMFGGVEQLLVYGNEEQKKKWLPKMAKGELLGAVGITEPFVGSDAASIETTARKEGDKYIINGKKRFITNAGVADIYCIYAKTSEKPEDRAKYTHLSAFLIEKGTPGFTVERINELAGWAGLPNGVLNFENVEVPIENRIDQEGAGWKVLVGGLNFERVLFAAGMLGPLREAIRYAYACSQKRIQFGQPTSEQPVNQFKIADMIVGLKTSRLLVYHAAHLLDMKAEAMADAAIAKLVTSEIYESLISAAIQVVGGDAWTRFYPLESYMRDAKVNQIGAGTSEVMRMVIYRGGTKEMSMDLKMPYRRMHEKLKVPISSAKPLPIVEPTEKGVLEILAEDYLVNPGLYMTRTEIKERIADISDQQLDGLLTNLEAKGLAKLYKDRKGTITMIKATYAGLREAKPQEYYKWYPEWISEEQIF
jgi:alkylation response protein AidB-like acyl-CoA dehydrogenase